MENLDLFERVIGETTRLVDGTTPEQLGLPTPCTEWTVRDVINHITGGATMFAVSAETGTVPPEVLAQISGDNLGDDYKGSYKAAVVRAMAAFQQPGIEEKMVELPFGTMPSPIALAIAVFDVTTHACDLSTSTGQAAPSDDMLATALAMGQAMIGPEMRTPGLFDAEQPAADGASATDQLLAFAGRKV